MAVDLSSRCAKCGTHIEIGNIKALPEGKGFVCNNCFARENGLGGTKPQLREPISVKEQDTISPEIFDAKDYVCDECGYEFKKSAEFDVKLCPYCGKNGVHQKVDKPAENLLHDAE